MLDKFFVRKLNQGDCHEFREQRKKWLALTDIRIERLKATQAKNPKWAAYDYLADDIVGIDTRIEEQLAVREELEAELGLISEREEVLRYTAAAIEKINAKPLAVQLGFFDTASQRERMGVT